MQTKLLVTGLAAALAACGGDNTTCGTGTTKMGNECVSTGGGGSGNDISCGTGTHQMGTICVPDDNTVAAAPTITMMDPAAAGIAGGGLFTITGTGFNGSNVSDLHVFFGDPTNANCEATLGAASATQVSGEVPVGCSLSPSVTVTVQTNLGSATTPFSYIMIFAGDGVGGGILFDSTNQSYQLGGSLYVIDPFAARSFSLGTLTDANGDAYSYGGMDFDANGTLFAATTGYATSDADATSQLLTIDLTTGDVTVVGDITDEAGTAYFVNDIKFVNGALYGWAGYDTDGNGTFGTSLISIDATTGAATVIGGAMTTTAWFGGLATDGTTLFAAPSGGAADTNFGVTGEYDAVNLTDGTLTNALTNNETALDWYNPAPIQAMTTLQGTTPTILAVVDNGTYGPISSDGTQWANETLVLIDPAADTTQAYMTNELFELPGTTGFAPHIDALAIPPATLVLQRQLPRAGWTDLKKSANARPLAHR